MKTSSLLRAVSVSLCLASVPLAHAGLTSRDDRDIRVWDSSRFDAAEFASAPSLFRSGPGWFLSSLWGNGSRPRSLATGYDHSGDPLQANRPDIVESETPDSLNPASFATSMLYVASTSAMTPGPVPLSVDGPAAWKSSPTDGNWNNDANWNPAYPNGASGLAVFGSSSITSIALSFNAFVADILFGSTAGAYTITTPAGITFEIGGAGVSNSSSATQNFVVGLGGLTRFSGSATAGNSLVKYTTNGGGPGGVLQLVNSSTAGSATFILNPGTTSTGSGGGLQLWDTASADHAIILANGSTLANPNGFGGSVDFLQSSDAGAATVIANGGIGPVTANTGGVIRFSQNSTGGTARIQLFNTGRLDLAGHIGGLTIGSLEGDGYVFLGGRTLSAGTNNLTTAFAGIISGTMAGDTAGGFTKVGTGTLILTGANTYTGDTTVAAGELMLGQNGSLAVSSAIRLGSTEMDSPSALFSFGPGMGGVTIGNDIIVQASASGTEGSRTILSLATNGNSNLLASNITMNTNLTVQSAAVGSTVANGPGTLHLSGTIDFLDNTLEMNSNLRGNNADTYAIQGIVIATGPLTSTLATGGSLVKDGSGTMVLFNTNNNYTGTNAAALNANGTQIRGGVLEIFGDGSLGLAPTNATNNLFFRNSAYNTNSDSIAPTLRADAAGITLAPTRSINLASGVNARFDSNGNTFTIAGNINGAGNLTKIGAGTLALAGANTYTGATTVNTGTLNAAVTGALGGTSGITVNRGGTLLVTGNGNLDRINNSAPIQLGTSTGTGTPTFARSGSGVVSEGTGAARNGLTVSGTSTVGLGALSLQSNAVFDFGANGVGTFTFNGFTSNTHTLDILNWTSNASFSTLTSGVDGIDDRLIFAGAPADIGFITINGVAATFIPLDTGFYEVVPVPEMSTWITGVLALGAVVCSKRKRFRCP